MQIGIRITCPVNRINMGRLRAIGVGSRIRSPCRRFRVNLDIATTPEVRS